MKLVRSAVAINVRWAANAICGDDYEESHRILRLVGRGSSASMSMDSDIGIEEG